MTFSFDADKLKASYRRAIRESAKKDPVVEVYSDWTPRNDSTLQEAVKAWRAKWRDPWFLSAHMQGAISTIILEQIVLPLHRGQRPRTRDALKRIGEQMLKAVQANLRNSRNIRGKMKKVSEKRAAMKKNLGLDKRTLFAEGNLYNSIKYRVQ